MNFILPLLVLDTDTSNRVPVSPFMADLFCNIVLVWQLKRQGLWKVVKCCVLNKANKKLDKERCIMSLMAVKSG